MITAISKARWRSGKRVLLTSTIAGSNPTLANISLSKIVFLYKNNIYYNLLVNII